MSYTALYRKWRSRDFDDLVGQDAITRSFKNQVSHDRIGHAYLFCGTRGTGKTSLAKILARAVNCLNPKDGNPCNECENCKAILSNTSINVYEMDAASNNKVDDIRLIREQVEYPPVGMRYKVYIIDEVHMLTESAHNAFLKTLEEPPEYAIFILATTEPNALPITILSRCQRYDFRRIPAEIIADRLRHIVEEEQIAIEEEAIQYIARMGDGSMRDAVSLLDQCASYDFQREISYEDTLKILGAVDTAAFSRMIASLREKDIAKAMALVSDVLEQGKELGQYTSDLLSYYRNIMLAKTVEQIEGLMDLSAENKKQLLSDAESLSMEEILRAIRLFTELLQQYRFARQKRVLLESTLVKLAHPEMEGKTDALLQRLRELEEKMENGSFLPVEKTAFSKGEVTEEKEVMEKEVILPKAQYEDYMLLKKDWDVIKTYFDSPSLKQALEKSRVYPAKDKKSMTIVPSLGLLTKLFTDKELMEIGRVISAKYKKEFHFVLGKVETEERSTKYVSDEDLNKISMTIEISDQE